MELKIEPFKFSFTNDVIKSILKLDTNHHHHEELLTPEVTIERIKRRKNKKPLPDISQNDIYQMDELTSDGISEYTSHFLLESNQMNNPSEIDCEESFSRYHSPHKCPICSYSAPKRDLLKSHIKSAHKEYKPFSCTLCSYCSLERKMLTRHFLSVHERFKPHKCPECDYSASLNSNLKKHVENVHRKNKPHKCPQCSYSTSEKGKLRRHVQSVHMNVRPFVCKLCSYSANRECTLRNHMSTVHNNEKLTFYCGECTFTTLEKPDLKKHVISLHRALQVLKCRKCDLYFSSKENLTRHNETSHTRIGPKLYECGDCHKIYRDKRSMKIHVLSIHLNERPFKCNYCSYRTVDTRYIRKHVASNHKT